MDGNGNPDYWCRAEGATAWHEEVVAFGGFYQPSIAWTGSSVVITAANNNGNLCYWWQPAGTTPWNPETVAGGAIYSTRSIAWTGNSVIISAADSYGNVDYWNPQLVS